MDSKIDRGRTIVTTEHERAYRRALASLREGRALVDVLIELHKAYKAIPTAWA